VFPPGANELLIDGSVDNDGNPVAPKLQIYYDAEDPRYTDPNHPEYDPNPRIDQTKILVHEQFVQRMLDENGVLVDGRLVLPRFITDPFVLFEEIRDDVIAQIDPAIISQLTDPTQVSSVTGLVDTILAEAQAQARLGVIQSVLSDSEKRFYLQGAYGQLPEAFAGQEFEPIEFPTTSKLRGSTWEEPGSPAIRHIWRSWAAFWEWPMSAS